ncbi:MAG: hemerythrin family protein [Magnetococcales bacterium]|nr:hemerythrin family protein [Magnetococcales bacterium]
MMIEQTHYMPDKYLLGHPGIDMQHEVLFALYHEVLHTLDGGKDHYDLEEVLAGLGMYTVNHFQFEEESMRSAGFEDGGRHVDEHRSLKERVGEFQGRFHGARDEGERCALTRDLADFLLTWLDHHIAEVDRLLCRFLLATTAKEALGC